jgi:hypothetical protein
MCVERERVSARRPQCEGGQARGQHQGRGADQLFGARAAEARARLGRRERHRADAHQAAARVQARLRRRLGQVPQHLLEDVQECVRRVHGPEARVVRHRLHGTGRLELGAAGLATDAPELRGRGQCDADRVGAPPLTLDRRAAGADDQHRLGLAPVGPPVRHVHLQGAAGLRLQGDAGRQPARHLRPEHLRRHVRLGLRRRLEAREQLPDAHRHRRLLLQRQSAR